MTCTPLSPLLEEAGIEDGAVEVLFTGLDRGIQGEVEHAYGRSLPLAEARRPEMLLAYEINGQTLPPQHGFPLRLIVPGWYGMSHVKWLDSITVLTEPFEGYQQKMQYRTKVTDEEVGEPVTRMLPRSMMIPPGIPDFPDRKRFLEAGPCELEGRAWSGWAPIARVEVSTDGGETRRSDRPSPSRSAPRARSITSSCPARPTEPATHSRTRRIGTPAAT